MKKDFDDFAAFFFLSFGLAALALGALFIKLLIVL